MMKSKILMKYYWKIHVCWNVLASLICIKVVFLIRKYQKCNAQIFRNIEKLTTLSVNLESVTCSRHNENRYLFFLVGGFALELPCHNFCGFKHLFIAYSFLACKFFWFCFLPCHDFSDMHSRQQKWFIKSPYATRKG